MTDSYQRLLCLAFLLLVACSDYDEYSPNQASDHNSSRELNKTNLQKLSSFPIDDTLTIAFIGDSQNFYNESDLFVKKVNLRKDIDLVLISGDISDYGLLQEFEWMAERLNKLHAPYIGVIGNHDLVANGEEVYKKMFGPLNFSFIYDSTKFIIHNTNSREYLSASVPDIDWLAKELAPEEGVRNFVAVSHVPPFDGDFDKDLESSYSELFHSTPGFLLSLHGHIHRHTDGYPYDDGIRYITSHSFEQKNFVLLKIISGKVMLEIISY